MQEYTMFDIFSALFSLLKDGVVWIVVTTSTAIFHFFSNPVVKIVSSIIIILLCIIIVLKLYKNRGGSMYKLKG